MDPLPDRGSTTSSMGCYYSTVSSYASFRSMESYPPEGQEQPPRPPPPPPPKKKIIPPLESPPIYHHHKSISFDSRTWKNSPEKLAELVTESADSERFGRLVLAMLVSLIITLSMASLVLWVLFGVDLPLFEIGAISVLKFTVTKSVIEVTTWRINVTVTNPNSEFKLSGNLINATILYNDYLLAMASILPVYREIDNNGSGDGLIRQADFYLEFGGGASVHVPEHIEAEVVRSLETGVLPVSLSVVVGSQFITDGDGNNNERRSWSQQTLKIYCGDLKILISHNGGDGYLAKESYGKECLTFA